MLMYEGRFGEASSRFREVVELDEAAKFPPQIRQEMTVLRGVLALRRGELDNCIACLGPSSCIFPIAPEAVHERQAGSREAIRYFAEYLRDRPDDVRVRWLLNLAYMTVGEYPEKVPADQLIPIDHFRSTLDPGHFANVAPTAGLTVRGPNQAGGAVFDDFTGDRLPDLMTTSLDSDRGASFFINHGEGKFEEHSSSAGLDDQVYALNLVQADYDNDGDLDVVMLRGGWEKPMRMSLLRNRGDGTFDDATLSAGLGLPIATESAAWADFDDDGHLDLFVCGESSASNRDPCDKCRLYRNKGDGTFEDVAARAGVTNDRYAKGCAWGDYDGDGRVDLFVSNRAEPCRLYRNVGGGRFHDMAPTLGVTGANRSFACFFWDYDNDGMLDLFVNDYSLTLAEYAGLVLGVRPSHDCGPRLYHNLGARGFRDVAREMGLEPTIASMGCNFGDIDNDGDLDLYFGTGGMSFSYLVPNRLLENVGDRFEDVTLSSGTGHLQKGHGVSFADYDADGDLDLFVEAGGGVPGDRSYNLLFRNPGNANHWLKVDLVGTKTNRSAFGARVRAVVDQPGGPARVIYRTVGTNASFGGNSLVVSLGLGAATRVAELEVTWPTSRTTQTFRDVPADQGIDIKEGEAVYRPWHWPARRASTTQRPAKTGTSASAAH